MEGIVVLLLFFSHVRIQRKFLTLETSSTNCFTRLEAPTSNQTYANEIHCASIVGDDLYEWKFTSLDRGFSMGV